MNQRRLMREASGGIRRYRNTLLDGLQHHQPMRDLQEAHLPSEAAELALFNAAKK